MAAMQETSNALVQTVTAEVVEETKKSPAVQKTGQPCGEQGWLEE